ncbi:MAG TPA: acyl-CoA dehydrogenase family protein [Kineosporiaceae bacterium]
MDDVETRLLAATRRVAADVLAPRAAEVDAGQVPRSHLEALAAAGVLGLHAPRSLGGAGASPTVAREVEEILAGADLSTWFVQVQHHHPVRALVAAGFDELLADLAAGRRVAGIALAHLRRPDPPVRAERDGGGWCLDGVAPWYTGWGLNDVALVGAVTPAGEVLLALVPARPGPGLVASAPLRTAALQAAVTVTLTFERHHLPGADVVGVRPYSQFAADDARRTANAQPAVFGLAASALRLLERRGAERGETEAVTAARRLADRLAEVRAEAYRLLDDVPPAELLDRRREVRAHAHRILVDATTALVIAGAGGSMVAGAPAQRMAREALFLLVQAQTGQTRRAALRSWGSASWGSAGEAGGLAPR